jgi:hypothetical protein
VKAFLAVVAALVGAALQAQDLPKQGSGNGLDFEPNLMLEPPLPTPAPSSPADEVKQLQAQLLIAQQRAAASEGLYKEGILAKVEVEERAIRVLQIEEELAAAQAALAAESAIAVKKSFDAHQATQASLDAANAALKAAQENAKTAAARFAKAELDEAILDLQRKRKLYAEGVATKTELELAEDRVALLSGSSGGEP